MITTHILKASCGAEVRLEFDEEEAVVTSINFDSSAGHELDPRFLEEYGAWFEGIYAHRKTK